MAKCLVKDPSRRPTAAQLLDHKFFKVRTRCPFLLDHAVQQHTTLPVSATVAKHTEIRQQRDSSLIISCSSASWLWRRRRMTKDTL